MMASAVVITVAHMMAFAALVTIWAGVIAPGLVGVVAFSVRPVTMWRPLVLRCFIFVTSCFRYIFTDCRGGCPSWILYHIRRKNQGVCDMASEKNKRKNLYFPSCPWPLGVVKTVEASTSFSSRLKRFILKLTKK